MGPGRSGSLAQGCSILVKPTVPPVGLRDRRVVRSTPACATPSGRSTQACLWEPRRAWRATAAAGVGGCSGCSGRDFGAGAKARKPALRTGREHIADDIAVGLRADQAAEGRVVAGAADDDAEPARRAAPARMTPAAPGTRWTHLEYAATKPSITSSLKFAGSLASLLRGGTG